MSGLQNCMEVEVPKAKDPNPLLKGSLKKSSLQIDTNN